MDDIRQLSPYYLRVPYRYVVAAVLATFATASPHSSSSPPSSIQIINQSSLTTPSFHLLLRMMTIKSTLALLLCLLKIVASLQVFDNVLNRQTRQVLHQVASEGGLSHKLVHRSSAPSSPLEHALVAILDELNDTSPYIEYWCRQEWRHIEAHADVDEFSARSGNHNFRYPTHGHVLYLQVGTQVKGPTCIFEECVSGGDLSTRPEVSLVTVPAVEGRLLRFTGNLLHAVPRPTDIWLLPYVQGSPDFNPSLFERSVVLFNTWQEPPLEVPQMEEPQECRVDEISVSPRNDWTEVDIIVEGKSPTVDLVAEDARNKRAKVWLLGDLPRRNHAMRTVHVYANEERLRQVLEHPTQPSRTTMQASST